MSKEAKAAKIIAIICFSLVFAALGVALGTDIGIFLEQIVTFIIACVASAVVFLFSIILMVLSCVLVFGIFLLESQGFWPATWTANTFNEIMSGAPISEDQLILMRIIRIFLILACVIALILAIIAINLNKSAFRENPANKSKLTKAFSVISLIFSILGLVVGAGTLFILGLL